jgi:hypothetical protein
VNTNRESIRPNKKASKKALVWTRRIFGLIAAAFVITIIVSITVSYFCLKVTDYTVKLDGLPGMQKSYASRICTVRNSAGETADS